MKTLVVGPYPLPISVEARDTMGTVQRLAAEGDDVEVFSANGTAAHQHGNISGFAGALDVWRASRSFDQVVVHAGGHAPLRGTFGRRARLVRLLDCLAWGLALRMTKRAVVIVPDLSLIPGSFGGRTGRLLWTGADVIYVVNEHSRQRMIEAGCCEPERIELLSAPPLTGARWDEGWDDATDQVSAEELIVLRAARDRRNAVRARGLALDAPDPAR